MCIFRQFDWENDCRAVERLWYCIVRRGFQSFGGTHRTSHERTRRKSMMTLYRWWYQFHNTIYFKEENAMLSFISPLRTSEHWIDGGRNAARKPPCGARPIVGNRLHIPLSWTRRCAAIHSGTMNDRFYFQYPRHVTVDGYLAYVDILTALRL